MKRIDRAVAFQLRPHRTPCHRSEEHADGGLEVGFLVPKPRWHRWLGDSQGVTEKTFQLDAYGRQVYEACDGRRTLEAIVRQFADRNAVSLAEAEVAVTAFLRTLIGKRLVVLPKAVSEEP